MAFTNAEGDRCKDSQYMATCFVNTTTKLSNNFNEVAKGNKYYSLLFGSYMEYEIYVFSIADNNRYYASYMPYIHDYFDRENSSFRHQTPFYVVEPPPRIPEEGRSFYTYFEFQEKDSRAQV